MHELGIVKQIVATIEDLAEQNHEDHISQLVLEIGELSQVIPEFVEDIWIDIRKTDEMLKDCELKIEIPEALVFCKVCGTSYHPTEENACCPKCGLKNFRIIDGGNLIIKSLAF
jgi:hydrogenase nickel incorporation protein HypA/HybF